MSKAEYINEIIDLINETNDIPLLDLIWKILKNSQ